MNLHNYIKIIKKTARRSHGGAPWAIRTLDLLFRRQTLYPAELMAHIPYLPVYYSIQNLLLQL